MVFTTVINDVEAKDRLFPGAPALLLTGGRDDADEEHGSSPHSFALTRTVAGSKRPNLQDRVIIL